MKLRRTASPSWADMTRDLLRLVADVLAWGWRRRLCTLIEWLRPGGGHDWLLNADPPMCRWCSVSRIEWRLR